MLSSYGEFVWFIMHVLGFRRFFTILNTISCIIRFDQTKTVVVVFAIPSVFYSLARQRRFSRPSLSPRGSSFTIGIYIYTRHTQGRAICLCGNGQTTFAARSLYELFFSCRQQTLESFSFYTVTILLHSSVHNIIISRRVSGR